MKKIKIKKNNFFKKNIIKIIRKLGYEIIDQNNLIIPTNNKKIDENLNILNNKSITLPLGKVEVTRKIENLLIVFRSFTNEDKLLSQNKKRIFESEKKEYTLRSLVSICRNIKNITSVHANNRSSNGFKHQSVALLQPFVDIDYKLQEHYNETVELGEIVRRYKNVLS